MDNYTYEEGSSQLYNYDDSDEQVTLQEETVETQDEFEAQQEDTKTIVLDGVSGKHTDAATGIVFIKGEPETVNADDADRLLARVDHHGNPLFSEV